MDPVNAIGTVLVASLLALGHYSRRRPRLERMKVCREAATTAGLTEVETGSSQVTGKSGPYSVRIAEFEGSKNRRGIAVVIDCGSRVTLRREALDTALEKAVGTREVEIGDEAFDRQVYVRGAPAVLLAVLDPETRKKVLELVLGAYLSPGQGRTAEAAILDGELRWELMETDPGFLKPHLANSLAALLDIGRRLAPPRDLPQRLADNVRLEPEWRVRLKALLILAEVFPSHPATRKALLRACQDEWAEVRLRAAMALGRAEGRATLLEVASQRYDDSCAARAIVALQDGVSQDMALTLLADALRARGVGTARACLERLGAIGGPDVVAPLAKVLAVEKGELALAAAHALGASEDPGAERPLLEALQRAGTDLRLAVASALGRVGSASAVLPLKEVAAKSGIEGRLRRAAQQAVAEIQSRLGGASPGQLSLAEGGSGQLSLADEDPKGRVSLADPTKPK